MTWDYSSVVEHATHNRLVAGSNPASPTLLIKNEKLIIKNTFILDTSIKNFITGLKISASIPLFLKFS